jgi:hypothetical protein
MTAAVKNGYELGVALIYSRNRSTGECVSLNFHLYFIHSSCIFHGYLTGSAYYLSMKQKIDPDIIFFVALILFVFFILRT